MSDSTQSTRYILDSPYLRVLSEYQCREIHMATLEALERTGIEVNEP